MKQYFPSQYTPSKSQNIILDKLEKCNNRFIIIQAPTGSGKSLISKTFANSSDGPNEMFVNLVKSYEAYKEDNVSTISTMKMFGTTVLTVTKTLQDQYVRLFNDCVLLKGKSNYRCNIDENCSVNFAPCLVSPRQKRRCWSDKVCDYYETRNESIVNKFSCYNYSMYLNLPEHLRQRQVLVCDEASELEDVIINTYTCDINLRTLKRFNLNIDINLKKPLPGINDFYNTLNERAKTLLNYLKGNMEMRVKEEFLYVSNMCQKIELVLDTWDNCEYIVEKTEKLLKITPLKADILSHKLFGENKKVVLMSGTIIDHYKFAQDLGIKDYDYIEVNSEFDHNKSPIYVCDNMKLSYTTLPKLLPKIVKIIKQILQDNKGKKGIIHTHTYDITRYIQDNLKDERLIFRDIGYNNEAMIQEHIDRKDDSVLVSPSMTHGIDLKGDLGEFQIIVKLPYPSLKDKRIKTLFDRDKKWYTNKMLSTLVQACGRTTRSKLDNSITYILDSNAVRAFTMNKNKLPKYFIDRVQ